LLANSVKFTKEGFIFLNITKHNKILNFEVIDTGCGMSEEKLKEIQKPHSSIKEKYTEGIGLGLLITR
jgi:signal transduction histidine kinase